MQEKYPMQDFSLHGTSLNLIPDFPAGFPQMTLSHSENLLSYPLKAMWREGVFISEKGQKARKWHKAKLGFAVL